MSAQAPAVPDQDTAFNNLFLGVRSRAFFHKLASHGFVPSTPEQERNYLILAEETKRYMSHPTVKAASDSRDPVAAAVRDLQAHMSHRGITPATKLANDQLVIDQAADQFLNDPTIYNSVLSLKAAEAAEFAAAHGLA